MNNSLSVGSLDIKTKIVEEREVLAWLDPMFPVTAKICNCTIKQPFPFCK